MNTLSLIRTLNRYSRNDTVVTPNTLGYLCPPIVCRPPDGGPATIAIVGDSRQALGRRLVAEGEVGGPVEIVQASEATVAGWAVMTQEKGIDIRTVSDSRRAAIVNFLVLYWNMMIVSWATDEEIEERWQDRSTGAEVVRVLVEFENKVKPTP